MAEIVVSNFTYRKQAFKYICFFVIFSCVFFSFYLGLTGRLIHMAMAMIGVVVELGVLACIYKCSQKTLEIIMRVYVVQFSVGLYFGMAFPSTPSASVLMLLMPPLAYFLTGKKFGFWVSLGSLCLSATLYPMYAKSMGAILGDVATIHTFIYSVAWVAIHHYEVVNYNIHKELQHKAMVDSLTGLKNRLGLYEIYQQMQMKHGQVSVALIDIDFFKRVNDTYGHLAGDFALKTVADTLNENAGKNNAAFRFGGEEFCVLIPKVDLDTAQEQAEKIRQAIEDMPCHYEGMDLKVTISIGLAMGADKSTKGMSDLFNSADELLYQAKDAGRNRVIAEKN